MRKSFLVGCLLTVASTFIAQGQTTPTLTTNPTYTKKRGLMLNVMFNDFKTPQLISSTSLTSVINKKQFTSLKEMGIGLNITYLESLSTNVDFASSLGASISDYPFKNRPSASSESLLLEGDVNVNIRLLPDNYIVNPYLTAGVGASYYDVHYGAYVPVGAGFQFRLGGEEIVRLQAQYRFGITEMTSNHFNFTLGFGSLWNTRKPALLPVPQPPVDPDTDGDGIPNSIDQCPDVKGVAQYNGCPVPDTDSDGLADDVDKCPTVAGLAKYQGCPIPDTDGDRINDEEDKCPSVAGVARLQGCPEKDTDGDGVMDDLDDCPTVAGPASNKGCPERKAPTEVEVKQVQEAAKFIYFETGSAKLKATSNPALSRVVTVMKNNEDALITIEGHTDNVGSATLNKKLSEDRAASVKKYLVNKGITDTRITSAGYSFDKPVGTNTTAAGRAKNRRVVMILE